MADQDEAAEAKPANATVKKAAPAKKTTAAKKTTKKATPAKKVAAKAVVADPEPTITEAPSVTETPAVVEKPAAKKAAAKKTAAKKTTTRKKAAAKPVAETTPSIDLTTKIDISDAAEQSTEEHVIDIKTLAESKTEVASVAAAPISTSAPAEVATSPVDEIAKPPRAPRKTAAPKTVKTTPAKTTAKKTTAKKATAKKAEPEPVDVAPVKIAPIEVTPVEVAPVEAEVTAAPVKPKRQPRKKATPKTPVVADQIVEAIEAPVVVEPVSLDIEDEEEASDRVAEATLEVAPQPVVAPKPVKPIDVAPVAPTRVPETTYQPIAKPAPQTVHLPAVISEPIATPSSLRRSTATLVTIILTAIVFLGVGLVLGSRSGQSGQATYTPTTLDPNAVTTAPVDPSSTTAASGTTGNAVTRLSGNDSRQSGLFTLGKGPVQIRYNSTGGNLTVRLLPASGVDSGDDFLCTSACDREADLVKSSGGQYYLDVQASGGGNWNVSVTD